MVGIDAAASQCRQRLAGSNMRSRARKLLTARQFGATPGYRECGYCAYNAICPARARGAFG